MNPFCILLCLFLFGFSTQKSTPEDKDYVGAVVEYLENANSTINLQNYVQLIQDAALQNADIIVFPELTLTLPNHVVVPVNGLLKDYPIPALEPTLFDEFLVSISSAAMKNEIYVVINVEELLDCSSGEVTGESCPERKIYIFNTNVVFDRRGAVIDRYRKINLFGERTRTTAFTPDLGIFDTDFGVTFGHFICFDLLFQVPAIQMVTKHNITNILFPVRWYSEMPFLSAVSIQQAYAFTMNVNFLAAGANDVKLGRAGSGIYSGKSGALVSLMTGIPTTRLLVSSVPKVPGQVIGTVQGPLYNEPSEQDGLLHTTDLSLSDHSTRLLEPGVLQQFTLFSGGVTCVFYVRFTERNAVQKYRYRAAAYRGLRTYNWIVSGGSRVCAVYACTNDTIESCGQRFPQYAPNSTAVFEALNITAGMPKSDNDEVLSVPTTVYFPVTLDTTLMPLKSPQYVFQEEHTNLDFFTVYELNLRDLDSELYSFGIWGREYATDKWEEPIENDNNSSTVPPPNPDSSCVNRVHTILLALFAIIALAL